MPAIEDRRRWEDFIAEAGAVRARGQMIRFNPFAEKRGAQPKEPNGPALWDKILGAVREIYELNYVCIAGGAIRDYLLDVPPKDIDVFVVLPMVDEVNGACISVEEIMELSNGLGWKNAVEANIPYGQNDIKNTIVFKASVFGYNIDFILTTGDSGRKIVDEFDYHICQHWYDKELNSDPLAKLDVAKKQWTLIGEMTKDKREHFNRFNKRNGGKYKLIGDEAWYEKPADTWTLCTAGTTMATIYKAMIG